MDPSEASSSAAMALQQHHQQQISSSHHHHHRQSYYNSSASTSAAAQILQQQQPATTSSAVGGSTSHHVSVIGGTGGAASTSAVHPDASPAETKIVEEFVLLLDKSKQLFHGLRDLPQTDQNIWQVHFEKAFDTFTRLWKFQQKHRSTLDSLYGLKRWQIGELASKIAQLYYLYYLRTSETAYLIESYSFYLAIRNRGYYSKAGKHERSDLMVKKLRCFARFVVVCLLLKKMKLVRDLVKDIMHQVEEYISVYEPEDQVSWSMLLSELKSFVDADNVLNVMDVDNSAVILSHRLTPFCAPCVVPPEERMLNANLPRFILREAVIVGSKYAQVKFSEFTIDMFWILQTLEWEPRDEIGSGCGGSGGGSSNCNNSPAPGRSPYDRGASSKAGENPHKFLLYKPTFSTLMLFLTNAFALLPPDSVLLLYISADGSFATPGAPATSHSYDFGGVHINVGKKDRSGPGGGVGADDQFHHHRTFRNQHCCHPGDLYMFLRKPFFLVVDSDNSTTFLGLPDLFGRPCVVLASPEELPAYLRERETKGSLLTLFLHSPLTGFCLLCNIGDIPISLWDKCQSLIDKFILEAGRQLTRSKHIHQSYMLFYGDDFLRIILLRFIFSYYVCRMHRSCRDSPTFHPTCHPPIQKTELSDHPSLRRIVLDLACILDVLSAFRDNEETVC